MAKNQHYAPTRTRHLPVPDGTVSGSPVKVGGFTGVTLTDEGKGGNKDNEATVALDGAFKIPVATTTAGAVGDPVYITSGNALTMTATSNTLFGHLLRAKSTTAGETCYVELDQN